MLGPELFLDSFDDIELCARVVVPGVGEKVVDLGLLLVERPDGGEGGLGRLAVFVVAGWWDKGKRRRRKRCIFV